MMSPLLGTPKRALTQRIRRGQSACGASRPGWQTPNLSREDGPLRLTVLNLMLPFLIRCRHGLVHEATREVCIFAGRREALVHELFQPAGVRMVDRIHVPLPGLILPGVEARDPRQ